MELEIPEPELQQRLLQYARENQLEQLKSIIGLTKNPDELVNQRSLVTGRCVLHEACAVGHKEVVKYLLNETMCDVSAKTFLGRAGPLHLAASQGNRSIVFLLLSHGANPVAQDRFGNTPLHLAPTKNIARLIVEYGGSVMIYNKWRKDAEQVAHERDPDNKPLLDYLAEIGHQEYLKMQKEIRRAKEIKRQASRIARRRKTKKINYYLK